MSSTLRIGERMIGGDSPPYVIAEIGVNHDGSATRASQLVRLAADAGADAVKFQWFRARDLVTSTAALAQYQRSTGAGGQLEMLEALELAPSAMADGCDLAHDLGMHAIVTVFCTSLLEEAAKVDWDAWKVASPDLVHRPLLARLQEMGRPIILSTGAATIEEVQRTCTWLGDAPTAFMQCLSSYPAGESHASLGGIGRIAATTGRPCGYSDHTIEETTGGLAVAAGACLLEKHFTHAQSAAGPDHATSLEPDGLGRYIEFAHRAHEAMGPRHAKAPRESEIEVRAVARQSIRAARSLEEGHRITSEDLVFKRPGDGMEPWELERLLGRRLARSLQEDEAIVMGDLA